MLYAEHRLSDTYSYSPIKLHDLPTPLKNKQLKILPIQSWFSLPLTPALSLVSVKAVKYSLSWCFLTSQTPTASNLQPFPLLSQTCIAVHSFQALSFCMDVLQKSFPTCTCLLKALHSTSWKFSSLHKHVPRAAVQQYCSST